MKSVYVLFLLISLVNIYSCQSQPVAGSVDAMTFNTQLSIAKDPVVLDVRTAKEYAGGYISNAINLDYYKPDFKAEIGKLDKEKTYFVYCAAGGRSKSAAELMRQQGFTKIYELNGGMTEWQSSNLPVVHKPD